MEPLAPLIEMTKLFFTFHITILCIKLVLFIRISMQSCKAPEHVMKILGFQVKIGCCSVDILKHLSGEEISRNPKDGAPIDRMGRLAKHILGQRRHVKLITLFEIRQMCWTLLTDQSH